MFDSIIMSHFKAGQKDEIVKVVLGAATPPGSVEEMLQAAEAIEPELAKITLVVQEEPASPEVDQMSEIAEAIEEICAVIGLKRRHPFDKSLSKCYICYKFGHFQAYSILSNIKPGRQSCANLLSEQTCLICSSWLI